MRPERGIVKKAIVDAGGNLSKTANILGCSRQSLYTWIYQFGLERLAGVRIDNRPVVDSDNRQDKARTNANKSGVYSAFGRGSKLSGVQGQTATMDLPIAATIRVRESLWKRVKITAIEKDTTVAALVEQALEHVVAEQPAKRQK